MSSLEDPEPEDSVEIRLTGRWPDDGRSEESEGVADGARSSLLMEAMDRRGDSGGGGRVMTSLLNQCPLNSLLWFYFCFPMFNRNQIKI